MRHHPLSLSSPPTIVTLTFELLNQLLIVSPKTQKKCFIKKQALQKFSETAKGWYWNMGKLYKKYAVKLEIMLSELKMSGK